MFAACTTPAPPAAKVGDRVFYSRQLSSMMKAVVGHSVSPTQASVSVWFAESAHQIVPAYARYAGQLASMMHATVGNSIS